MPGMYSKGDYDLAGFCVGVVEKSRIITGQNVCAGDVLVGLPSTGPHSNGYSLIRKVLERSQAKLEQAFDGATLGERLLAPTEIYVKPLLALFEKVTVKALAHITGGGLLENLPRVMPENTRVVIDSSTWQRPAVFDWLQEQGKIQDTEMYRTFNCGIGMGLFLNPADVASTLEYLNQAGLAAVQIGQVEPCNTGDEQVIIKK